MWAADVPLSSDWVPGAVLLISDATPPVNVPTISGISPSTLYRNETTRVTIVGTNLTGAVLTASSTDILLSQVVADGTSVTASVGVGANITDSTYYLTATTGSGTASIGVQVMSRPVSPGTDVDTIVAALTTSPEYLAAVADTAINRTMAGEDYAANGAEPTLKQALYMLLQLAAEKTIDTTTRVMTVKKLDGTTPAMTFQLDSATAPKTITRIS